MTLGVHLTRTSVKASLMLHHLTVSLLTLQWHNSIAKECGYQTGAHPVLVWHLALYETKNNDKENT